MHNRDLGLFFLQMANKIKHYTSPSQRRIVFAYTAGFLAHYAMDVATHGYVYGQTHFPPHPAIKESTRHRHFETSIDVLMLDLLRGQKPADYQLEKLIAPRDVYKRAAAVAMAESVRQVYGRNIHPWDVYNAMGHMAHLTNVLQSKNGVRKEIIGRAEDITVGTRIISALIHMQEVTDLGRDYLNLKHAPWRAPWATPEVARNESFPDLFQIAVADAAVLIQNLYDYTKGKIAYAQLADTIQNRSLKTGFNA
jgi:hypothetical protein